MNFAENKYYLRPNCFIDRNLGLKLSKTDEAIKVGGVFFSYIEVIQRNKKKIIRQNLPLKKFYKLAKKNTYLNKLQEKLLTNEKINKNKVFKKNRYLIFGILNLTPDSFSDGGDFNKYSDSFKQAKYMYENGANYIDVGGESTRPGARRVNSSDEF